MGQPGHEFDKTKGACSCGWKPRQGALVHPEQQWSNHLEANAPRGTGVSREAALQVLRRLANSTGDSTLPTEDVIDLAQAVLALLGEQ